MQIGNVPTPDCFNTFGLLGAELSCSMLHFALPLPVTALFQPRGSAPALASSKLTVSAIATPERRPVIMISVCIVFIVGSSYLVPCFVCCKNELHGLRESLLQCTAGVVTPDNPVTRSAPLTACANFLAEPLPQ